MLTDDDLAYASIGEVAPRVRSGEVSPVALTEACLQRIDQLDSRINAFITVLNDSALAEARQAEKEIQSGNYRGLLHGIPIAHKDLYYTKDVRTTAGSKVLSDFVPDEDSTVVAKLKEAGTVMLGKLNMHEFAAGGTSDNPHYGAVHNPWKPEYIPGGSSGGSAAALAAGMCLGSTGSDTAGSIRIPSFCCGTTGIKPTYGRVSCFGVVPLSWSLDHAGPMTRTAEDAALMLNVMAGFDGRDEASVNRDVPDFTLGLEAGVRGLRLGIPRTYFNEGLQPGVELAWREAIEVLLRLGAVPVEVDFPEMSRAVSMGTTLLGPESTAFHSDWFKERPQDYSPAMAARFAANSQVTAVDYIKAQRARALIRADMQAALARADVILSPTMPIAATPIGAPQDQRMVQFTYPYNLSGFPALSVPCGFDRDGLPVGLQIGAAAWQEDVALRVGHAYQAATDWHKLRPPLA